MRRLLILAISFFGVWVGASEIALSVTYCPTGGSDIFRKISVPSSRLLAQTDSASLLFVTTPENSFAPLLVFRATNPSAFIQKAKSDENLGRFTYVSKGTWIIGAKNGADITPSQFDAIVSHIPAPSKEIIALFYPAVLSGALKSSARPEYAPLLEELSALNAITARLDPSSGKIARIVLSAQAHPGSDIATFFNQRLPKGFSAPYRYVDIQASPAYGYFFFNPEAMDIYSSVLKSHGLKLPMLQALGSSQMGPSDGQVALWVDPTGAFMGLGTGRWTRGQADGLLKQLEGALANTEISYAFTMGQSPVWAIRQSQRTPAYAALYKGSLIFAPSREKMYALYEQLDERQLPQQSLPSALGNYGNTAAQMIIKPRAFLQTFQAQSGLCRALSLFFDDTPIYLGLSIGNSSATLTADIPWNMLNVLFQFALYPQTIPEF